MRLRSRTGRDVTALWMDLAVAAAMRLPPGVVLDGEAVIYLADDEGGARISFEAARSRALSSTRRARLLVPHTDLGSPAARWISPPKAPAAPHTPRALSRHAHPLHQSLHGGAPITRHSAPSWDRCGRAARHGRLGSPPSLRTVRLFTDQGVWGGASA
ncbi:hypothetical protein OG949_41965 (plasmid) [Streptomyces scopuliridis]|nr:hypothetical protein OG949_41965 [Streptomyces scopuliridis]